MQENKNTNQLLLYRKRSRLSQKQVARLLGDRDESVLSRYERGEVLPPLESALKLEIIYRIPAAFLFPGLYGRLREDIRSLESKLPRAAGKRSVQ